MAKKQTRLNWSKLPVPPDLSDLLYMISKSKGYRREEIHFFLYHMLKTLYSEDVERLAKYFETDWLDKPPD